MPKKSLRVCSACGDELSLKDFYYRADRDYVSTVCKRCTRQTAREWYEKNREIKLRRDKVYSRTSRGREVNKRAKRKYNKSEKGHAAFRRRYVRDAEKVLAMRVLNHAVARGDLVRPMRCTNCGLARKTEGHHSDYSKPLDVTWLCPKCHKTEDKEVCYA